MYLGIDIGGTAVKIGLVDRKGTIHAYDSYEVSFDNYATPIIETIVKSTHLFLEKHDFKSDSLLGIGVSATGQIDTKNGTVIGGNIEHWIGVPIKKIMEQEFHLHTTVINDANAMILGEQWVGAAKDKQHVIGITIGTGLGGGIVIDGNILLGAQGIAGELGHFSIIKNGIPCTCGNCGCFERYGATTALVRMVKEAYEQLHITENREDIDGKLIFDYAKKGNVGILQIIDQWIDYIVVGFVSLVHIFNPEIIVIGGAVCQQEDLFMNVVKQKVYNQVMPRFKDGLQIQAATLKNNAGLVGAVYYTIQHS